MLPRDGILVGIDLISRHFPSFAPRDDAQLRGVVDDYEQAACWTDGNTIAAGFRLALDRAGKFPPRYPDVVQAIKDAHRIRNVHAQPANPDDDGVVCRACGSRGLTELPHPNDPQMPTRLYPLHRDGCRVALPAYARRSA